MNGIKTGPRDWSEASVPYSSSKEISVRGFADRHKLALVTWTNFKGYVTGSSGDEMDRKEYAEYDRNFNQRVREWENGYRRLATRYSLPREKPAAPLLI